MVFFMITSFLFFGRLLDAKKNGIAINWLHLYTSRFMRISPLFLLAVTFAFGVAGYAYNWEFNADLKESLWRVLLTFGMGLFGAPIVDSFIPTGIGGPVMAFALWTLPYEWIFYFMLPVFAGLLKLKFSKYFFIIPAIAVFYLLEFKLFRVQAHPFVSGILVALLVRTSLTKYLKGWASALLSILLIAFSILTFSDPFSFYPLLILSFFFSVVASGNSFFGILNLRISRVMGEISFGIYLLHGVILFALVRIYIGDSASASLEQFEYWNYILICIPILFTICYITFIQIEKPCMNLTAGFIKKILGLLNKRELQ